MKDQFIPGLFDSRKVGDMSIDELRTLSDLLKSRSDTLNSRVARPIRIASRAITRKGDDQIHAIHKLQERVDELENELLFEREQSARSELCMKQLEAENIALKATKSALETAKLRVEFENKSILKDNHTLKEDAVALSWFLETAIEIRDGKLEESASRFVKWLSENENHQIKKRYLSVSPVQGQLPLLRVV